MTNSLSCPHCKNELPYNPLWAGHKANCPVCNQAFVVPVYLTPQDAAAHQHSIAKSTKPNTKVLLAIMLAMPVLLCNMYACSGIFLGDGEGDLEDAGGEAAVTIEEDAFEYLTVRQLAHKVIADSEAAKAKYEGERLVVSGQALNAVMTDSWGPHVRMETPSGAIVIVQFDRFELASQASNTNLAVSGRIAEVQNHPSGEILIRIDESKVIDELHSVATFDYSSETRFDFLRELASMVEVGSAQGLVQSNQFPSDTYTVLVNCEWDSFVGTFGEPHHGFNTGALFSETFVPQPQIWSYRCSDGIIAFSITPLGLMMDGSGRIVTEKAARIVINEQNLQL